MNAVAALATVLVTEQRGLFEHRLGKEALSPSTVTGPLQRQSACHCGMWQDYDG